MLIRFPKNATQRQWLDHTEIENVDLVKRIQSFIMPGGDRLYEVENCELEPGDVVIDLGCNIGLWAIMAVMRGASVIRAFEPNVANHECAFENINKTARLYGLHCGSFSVDQLAIADKYGQAEFYDGPTISQHGLIASRPGVQSADLPSRLVAAWTIDDVFRNYKMTHCDFWKCDANGSEYLVFRGVSDATLKKIRKIGMQYHHWVEEFDPDFLTNLELRLHGLGFETLITRVNEFGDCYLHAWQTKKKGKK